MRSDAESAESRDQHYAPTPRHDLTHPCRGSCRRRRLVGCHPVSPGCGPSSVMTPRNVGLRAGDAAASHRAADGAGRSIKRARTWAHGSSRGAAAEPRALGRRSRQKLELSGLAHWPLALVAGRARTFEKSVSTCSQTFRPRRGFSPALVRSTLPIGHSAKIAGPMPRVRLRAPTARHSTLWRPSAARQPEPHHRRQSPRAMPTLAVLGAT